MGYVNSLEGIIHWIVFLPDERLFFFRWVRSTLWTSGPWNLPSWELTSLLQFGTFEDDLDTLLPSSVEFHPVPEKTFKSFFFVRCRFFKEDCCGGGGVVLFFSTILGGSFKYVLFSSLFGEMNGNDTINIFQML